MFFFLFKQFFLSLLLAVLFWQVDLAAVCLQICPACRSLAHAGVGMRGEVPSSSRSSVRHISEPSHSINRDVRSHRVNPTSIIHSHVDHFSHLDHHNMTSGESESSKQTNSVFSESFSGTSGYESSVVLAVNPDQPILDTAKAQGLRIRSSVTFSHLGMTVTAFDVPGGEDAANVLARFHSKGLSGVMLNQYYRLDEGPKKKNVQYGYPGPLIQWPMPCLSCGHGVKIGMVDSYVDTGMPLLAGQKITCKVFARQAENMHVDHGTAIAELLVGGPSRRFCGLVPDADLFAAAAFSEQNSDAPRATALAIIQSLDWLVSKKVQVINLSFSGPDNGMLAMAMNKVGEKRIPLVAAAGNYGSAAPPAYPAAYDDVIAVTAVDRFRRPYPEANQGTYIDFAAPGVRVPVPCRKGEICYKSGTSYATPYCTALIARILRSGEKKESIKKLAVKLRKNVEDLGPPGKDPVFGWGLVQCGKGCRSKLK